MSVDPKEYQKMVVPDYEQLLQMLDSGIVKKIRSKPKHKPFPFGFRGGHYLGSPGKDVYFCLPKLTSDQFTVVANRVADLFPRTPPDNHLHWAACIRYIYGCFEKQGCLRSTEDKNRMVIENPDWDLPFRFMNEVRNRFKHNRNKYGLVIHYEMRAHRFGDKAIFAQNMALLEDVVANLQEMTRCYMKSSKIASEIKCWKQMFTPYYWCAHYYYEIGDKENAARYHWLNLESMEKYCPDARDGYREKAVSSLRQLNGCVDEKRWQEVRKWLKKCKNKCLVKIRGPFV